MKCHSAALRRGEKKKKKENGGMKERRKQFTSTWWEKLFCLLTGRSVLPLNSGGFCSCCCTPWEISSLEGQQHLHARKKKAANISPPWLKPNVSSTDPFPPHHAAPQEHTVCINACRIMHRLVWTPLYTCMKCDAEKHTHAHIDKHRVLLGIQEVKIKRDFHWLILPGRNLE